MDINERKSLSRVQEHISKHDCGIVTALRYAEDCGEGRKYTKAELLKRTKELVNRIHSQRYNVTVMRGKYIENYKSDKARDVGELVLFVVDVDNGGKLFDDLKAWGEAYEQDSVLYIPKEGTQGDIKAILYGTNHCPKAYPGWGKSVKYTKRMIGSTGEFFTTIKDRPFVFAENLDLDHFPRPQGFFGRWACSSMAKVKWQDIELDEYWIGIGNKYLI
jgi:hypothetical protein